MNNSPKEPLLTLFRALLSPGSRQLYTGKMNRFIALCCLLTLVGLGSGGCAKVHKIEGESWEIKGAEGSVSIEAGKYHFGPKKRNPKETWVTEYSKYACYYKFRLVNGTNRSLQIKTMGYLLDKSGNELATVITSYYGLLAPGKTENFEGFFGVKPKDVRATTRFKVTLDDVHLKR